MDKLSQVQSHSQTPAIASILPMDVQTLPQPAVTNTSVASAVAEGTQDMNVNRTRKPPQSLPPKYL